MPLFNFKKKAARDEVPAEQSVQLDDVLLSALLNHETITRDKALTLPAVSSAVDYIAATVASMPIRLYHYKLVGEGDDKKRAVEEVERDSRVRLLNGDTGDTLNAFQMKKAMVEDYLLGKGGYAYVARNRNYVTSLHYVQDIYVLPYENTDPIYKYITFQIDTKVYRDMDVLRILRNTKNGASGRGVIDEVSKCLQTAYATLIYQLGLAKTGGSKKGFLKSERRLGQQEIDALKLAWQKLFGGNEENVVVLNQGIDFKEASATSAEMQLNQNKKTLTDEINSIFHVYSNDFDRTFKEAIYPIIKAFEASLNRTLLLESEKLNYFFEFDVKEIIRADIQKRFNAYQTAIKNGFMSLNEVRRAENMNSVDGLDVFNFGLSAVLYDPNTRTYYTPNTGEVANGSGESTKNNNKEGANNEKA